MNKLTFEYLKKLIDEHFSGLSDDDFNANLEKAGFDFYQDVTFPIIDDLYCNTFSHSMNRKFIEIHFVEFFDLDSDEYDYAMAA